VRVHTDTVSLIVAGAAGSLVASALLDGAVLAALLFAVVGVAVLTRRHAGAGDA